MLDIFSYPSLLCLDWFHARSVNEHILHQQTGLLTLRSDSTINRHDSRREARLEAAQLADGDSESLFEPAPDGRRIKPCFRQAFILLVVREREQLRVTDRF